MTRLALRATTVRNISLLLALLLLSVALKRRRAPPSEPALDLQNDPPPPAGPPEDFRFLHLPATPISFVSTLRNTLLSCSVKNFSCPRLDSSLAEIKQAGVRYDLDDEALLAVIHCGGNLWACDDGVTQNTTHMPWASLGIAEKNVVTVVRHPLVGLWTLFNATWDRGRPVIGWSYSSAVPGRTFEKFEKTLLACRKNMSADANCNHWASDNGYVSSIGKLFAGHYADDVEDCAMGEEAWAVARRRLLNETVFVGVLERWNESVCVFHCLFRGEAQSYEFVREGMEREWSVADLDRELGKEARAFLESIGKEGLGLYGEAVALFDRKVERCGCRPDGSRPAPIAQVVKSAAPADGPEVGVDGEGREDRRDAEAAGGLSA